MLAELLKEFVLELVRSLFLEELCERVKLRLAEHVEHRRKARQQALFRRLRIQHRDRLLHRLTTGLLREL